MLSTLPSLAYLVSTVLFILSIRGLSHPKSAMSGLRMGMIGMAIAVVTTLFLTDAAMMVWILAGIAIGGAIGGGVSAKVEMTSLPQLVAMFNALVGLAAVLVGAAAFYNPEAYGIGIPGAIDYPTLQVFMNVYLGYGARFLNDEGMCGFDSPEFREALQYYTDLYLVDEVTPPDTPNYSREQLVQMLETATLLF